MSGMSTGSPPPRALPDAADYATTLRAWLAHVAAHDPGRRRFGAHGHGYSLRAPLGEARVAAIEAQLGVALPSSYRSFVAEVGDGGAGPYHGLFPLDHPLQLELAASGAGPSEQAPYGGVVGLGHVGCGYIAFLVVRGDAAGEVWLDARGSGDGVRPVHADFRDYYHAWIVDVTANRLPPAHVTAGRCALPSALSSYLGAIEERAGLAAGTLDGDALRAALGDIGDGGIATTTSGDDPFFAAGDPIDLCPHCEQLVENLIPKGLRRAQIAPGLPPLLLRAGQRSDA
jgi:hypothetical protein